MVDIAFVRIWRVKWDMYAFSSQVHDDHTNAGS